MNVLYKRILRMVNWDMGTFPLLEVWKMKKGKCSSCWRPLMGVVAVGALALGVSALAAPRPVDDSAVRGTNKGRTEVTRLVTGDPAQINAVVAADPPTGIIAISPVPAKNLTPPGSPPNAYPGDWAIEKRCAGGTNDGAVCTLPADCPPAGVGVCLGKKLSTASSEGFRAFFDVTVSSWDPQQPNDGPYVHTVQVSINAAGYMNGIGANLAPPLIACTNDSAGNALCRAAFGEDWAKCELSTCKPGYVDKSGTKRAAENWCAPDGCNQGDVDTSTYFYRFFVIAETSQLDRHYAHYVGSLVLDIPGKESVDGPAKGVYTVNPRSAETFLDDGTIDIPTLQENGFIVEIKLGSCCHNLGTPEAGCIDALLSNECEIPSNGPYFWNPGDACDNPPTADGCRQCLIVGRNTDPMCDDGDECTDDDCTPIFTCTHSAIGGWDTGTECCEGGGASPVITVLEDGDACTVDTCVNSPPNPPKPPAMETGTANHDPVAAGGLTCNDGNPCTTPDLCDGVHSQAGGGCVGADVNLVTCPAHVCPNDPLGVPYPCVDGFCFCTLTPKATFVLNTPAPKTCSAGSAGVGTPCAKDADCGVAGICDLYADGANCFDSGDKITALVHLGASGGPINGGELLMTYDPSCVDYKSAICLSPYTETVYGPIVNEAAGTIFIVCGVNPFGNLVKKCSGLPDASCTGTGQGSCPTGQTCEFVNPNGPLGNTDMVLLSFNKIGECNKCELCFASNNPQNSYLVDDEGQRVDIEPQCKELQAKGILVLDVPDNILTNADCDGPTAVETWDPPTATFSCPDGAGLICRGAHESGMNMNTWAMGGGVFPQGFSSFCCYAWALDECDQHVGCPPTSSAHDCGQQLGKPVGCWTVEVTDQVSLDIVVQLEPPIVTANHDGTLTRCIKFCLFADAVQEPICYEDDVTFGGMYNFIGKSRGKIKVAGTQQWGCISAQDQLHTLRSCYEFNYASDCRDGQLYAQFSGDPAFGGDSNWLIGGNLDGWKKDDTGGVITNPNGASLDVIDVLDFGMFVSQFGVTYADNDTPCPILSANADINGDGTVNVADYNFIVKNFLLSAKECCGGPQAASPPAPLAEVSVDELRQMGLGDLVVADLNGDGLVNTEDMDAFTQGARPTKTSNDRTGGKGLRSGR